MNKMRKGDDVIVLTGKDKGKRGTVTRVIVENNKVVIENINVAKKHQKPNPASGTPGGIVEVEMPMQASNVAVYNSATGKADRIGFKTLEDGRKVRYFKSNGEVVDV
ncbi:LSU ribosomal protein L24p (L26e) [hydrothermal vent metagenome]|uniref:LSU ribosomal protein L24p (L26e) n=1 Tax=hydrothermal vent metagenome TaxID=652676 RepID=A0A3B0ZCG3_9ZZZZ